MHITSGYVFDMFSDPNIPLTVVWYLVYFEYCTDEQIITISHLVLQVYCSPSLKKQVHNPIMPLMARNKERKETILRAVVCVWWCGCVVVCTYAF